MFDTMTSKPESVVMGASITVRFFRACNRPSHHPKSPVKLSTMKRSCSEDANPTDGAAEGAGTPQSTKLKWVKLAVAIASKSVGLSVAVAGQFCTESVVNKWLVGSHVSTAGDSTSQAFGPTVIPRSFNAVNCLAFSAPPAATTGPAATGPAVTGAGEAKGPALVGTGAVLAGAAAATGGTATGGRTGAVFGAAATTGATFGASTTAGGIFGAAATTGATTGGGITGAFTGAGFTATGARTGGTAGTASACVPT